MFKFLVICNKEGNFYFLHYFQSDGPRSNLIVQDAIKVCQADENQAHYVQKGDTMYVHRAFGPSHIILACDETENEILAYEFIYLFVSTLREYFDKKLTEDVIFLNVDKIHMVLEEFVLEGHLVESSMKNVLCMLELTGGGHVSLWKNINLCCKAKQKEFSG